ncbi:PIN domain-containing protein [Aeromonas enteropelogenes]|uniref:PIN domain-containing protein n=1 Tax=Aeromonas enteropelogenes TaxID=29489 RepID=UPI0038D243F7
MQVLISDANILIDMEVGALLDRMFQLPYQFMTPDVLFEEELKASHPYLLALGLQLGELSGAHLATVFELNDRYGGPSIHDCFALALAKQERCPLLTGDRALTNAAKREAVVVMGTLWVVEQMVVHGILTKEEALQGYEDMRTNGSRLPWELARKNILEL